jgi:hypothetical protein
MNLHSGAPAVMRWIRIHLMFAAIFAGAGCALMASGVHNAINEPRLALSERRFERTCRRLAEEALSRRTDAASASSDFRDGYLDGYADYLRGGRTVAPPPVPPNRYARIAYHTPESLREVNEYTAGFEQGAADAVASGDRQRVVVPATLPCCDRSNPFGEQLPAAAPAPAPKNSDGEMRQEPR